MSIPLSENAAQTIPVYSLHLSSEKLGLFSFHGGSSAFPMTHVPEALTGTLTRNAGEIGLQSAVIDSDAGFAYFGTFRDLILP